MFTKRLSCQGFGVRFSISVLSAAFTLLAVDAEAADERADFATQIRPILSDRCFACHGPSKASKRTGLRLDIREDALRAREGRAPIVPGNPEASELVRRISATDEAEIMPPPEAKNPLTERERSLLRRWIAEGAEYESHWAFTPIAKPGLPAVKRAVPTPLDAFVQASLEKAGFGLAAEATREKLIRRVAFDLTGLPPTLAEIDAFLKDPTDNAYERVVDEYLSRESYGERMASEWLDVARYSDTYGYQVDRDRHVWPYRDWVIKAFNRNLRHDRFIVEQVAGDLLPDATKDQILATAFNRLHPQKVEGGSTPEEFRVEYVADRTQTFATAFLALTFECARCHEHKYDPFTQEEYYGLASFFDNIDEAGLYSFFTPSVPTPAMLLSTDQQDAAMAEARAKIRSAEAALVAARRADRQTVKMGQAMVPGLLGWFSFNEGDGLGNVVKPTDNLNGLARNSLVTGREGQALRLTGDDEVRLSFGNFTRTDPFTIALWLKSPEAFERAVILHRSRAWTDAASRGYELLIEEGRLSAALIHFWPGNAIRVRTRDPLPVKQWTHVAMTYDGSSRANGLRLHVNGAEVPVEVVRDRLTKQITGGGNDVITIGARFRDRGFKGGLVDDLKVFDRELTALEVGELHAPGSLAAALRSPGENVGSYLTATRGEQTGAARDRLGKARRALANLVDSIPEIMVMRETAERPTRFLYRGAYDAPRQEIASVTPAFLHAYPDDAPRNRLGLAKWLVDPSNPLTARVIVNRYWQMFFGRGLVRTANDFGSQGEPPTHPGLLNWLAADFMEHGWDLKRLVKQMVLSATYRQSSVAPAELVGHDPENRLLGRAPRYRWSAEMIRDNALAVSGLLVDKIGGPSVKPYEIAESFKPSAPDKGAGLYRRSLYTYWKRTAPAPVMIALDAARRDVCSVRREPTATPLQAFVFMNDPQFVEAARVLAARVWHDSGGDPSAALARLFRLLTSRRATEAEQRVLRRMFEEQREQYAAQPRDAEALLTTGRAKAAAKGPEAAALTVAAIALLSHDECVMKR